MFCGTDYIGMAEDDIESPTRSASLQDLSNFPHAPRPQPAGPPELHDPRPADDPRPTASSPTPAFQHDGGQPAVDGSDLVYYGLSQGGIMGGALDRGRPDIDPGVLGVPGMNYCTLLDRSVDFDPFFAVLPPPTRAPLDRMLMLSAHPDAVGPGRGQRLRQPHDRPIPLPGTPTKEVLLQVAFGDHQVTQFAADVQARTYGAATNDPPLGDDRVPDVTPLWGIERISSWPYAGSAIIYWDSRHADAPVHATSHRARRSTARTPTASPGATRTSRSRSASSCVPAGWWSTPATARPASPIPRPDPR